MSPWIFTVCPCVPPNGQYVQSSVNVVHNLARVRDDDVVGHACAGLVLPYHTNTASLCYITKRPWPLTTGLPQIVPYHTTIPVVPPSSYRYHTIYQLHINCPLNSRSIENRPTCTSRAAQLAFRNGFGPRTRRLRLDTAYLGQSCPGTSRMHADGRLRTYFNEGQCLSTRHMFQPLL